MGASNLTHTSGTRIPRRSFPDLIGIGEWAAMGTALAWTLSALAWTAAGKRIGALATSFIRLIMASLLLAGYGQLVRGRWLPTDASPDTWLYLGLSGFFGFFVADLFLFRALVLIGPRLALLVQSLTPPITALMSWACLGDRIGGLDWIGMVLTLAGITWVILGRTSPTTTYLSRDDLRQGLMLAIAACFAQAIGFVFSKQGIGDYDAVAGTFIRVLASLPCFLVLITITRRWSTIRAAARQTRTMAIVAYGSFVGPFLGVALSLVAIRLCHAGVAATLISTSPVLILPFVVLVYRERLSPQAVGGALLSVLGVALLVL
jgi:drug/metabolite transporter (DMT)-like permease